jgi:addiction module RelB/DinJ family antitoxin
MNTAVINIKTEPQTKREAQQIAAEIGVSLSALINAYLKKLIRTKKVEHALDETPNTYFIKTIKEAEQNYKKGNYSPVFKTGEEAVKWLEEQGI